MAGSFVTDLTQRFLKAVLNRHARIRSVARVHEVSRQMLVVYAAAVLAVALIGARYLRSATVPKNAVKGSLLRGYVEALETFDPTRGTKFSSHFYNGVGRTGRYLQRYTNVGRIPEERGGLISLLQSREPSL